MKLPASPPEPFKITRSTCQANSSPDSNPILLKNYKTSILGDIFFPVGDDNYTLDRSMLASKSPRFEQLMLSDEETIAIDMINTVPREGSRFRHIVDIIYGKDVQSILNEDNFVTLLTDMIKMELETDLKIFKKFIKKIIYPKAQLNVRMFELLDVLSQNRPKFDYLLPTVSGYFSNRMLKIYEKEEFMRLSVDDFILVLLQENDDQLEKRSIGRVCAEWICHDYRNRIREMKDLVNATKYRYDVVPYCDWDPDSESEILRLSDDPDVEEVEKYFNELFSFYLGEVSFEPSSRLNANLNLEKTGTRVLFSNDQAIKWTSYLDKELFCDVAINVQGTIFKLHRIKLSSVSGYLYELFTDPSEALAFEVVNSEGELKMTEHSFHQIDPATFESIVRYIYKQEIEVTSVTELINLSDGSKFLKIDDLLENCSTKLLEIARAGDRSVNIFEIFQYVCESKTCSDMYTAMVETIVALWPELGENPHFETVSLDVLKEIVQLADLKINDTDEILDLCSKWIFHDYQNRLKYTVELAKAINRNFTTNSKLALEIPSESIDFSQQYVKQQLSRILSSNGLIALNIDIIQKDEQRPCFLALKDNKIKTLSVLDSKFKEILQIPFTRHYTGCHSSATVVGNDLFVLFRVGDRFYFQLYRTSSKRTILLASDARMDPKQLFVILSCNDRVYFCSNKILLRYSVEFNRWVPFLTDDTESRKIYTSDGEKLYQVLANRNETGGKFCNKASFYDFEMNAWITLPDIPTEDEEPKEARIINRELNVMFSSKTFSFNWMSQTWTGIPHKITLLAEFNSRGQNVVYVDFMNEVYLYSPLLNEWKFERKLDIYGRVIAIHKISA